MSIVTTTIEDQFQNNCSILTFSVDGVPVTQYTYKAGKITLSTRTTTHLNSVAGFVSGLATVGKWMKSLDNVDPAPKRNNLQTFKMSSVLNKQGILQMQYNIGKARVIRVQYDRATHILRFFPRSEITLNLEDFQMLFLYNKSIIAYVQLIDAVNITDDLDPSITAEIL